MSDKYAWIDDIPLPSVEEISNSLSRETDEIELDKPDSKIVVGGSQEAEEIEISFVLSEKIHPERKNIYKQRDDLKSLTSSDASHKDFTYEDLEGYLSVEDVSLSESGSTSNLREASIQAIYLPWPKNFGESRPKIKKGISNNIDYSLSSRGTIARFIPLSDGFILYETQTSGDIEKIKAVNIESKANPSLDIDSSISAFFNLDSNINFNLEKRDVNLNVKKSAGSLLDFSFFTKNNIDFSENFGRSFGGVGSPLLNILVSANSNTNYSLISYSSKGFGASFGENFSNEFQGVQLNKEEVVGYGSGVYSGGQYQETLVGYSSETYGSGIYG